MPVVQATWAGHTSVVAYSVASFSDIVQGEDEESLHPRFSNLFCCRENFESHTHRHGPYIASHIAASLGYDAILRVWGDSCAEWLDDLPGRTPLHWAAYYGRDNVVRYLLSVGAVANATNNYGITPLLDWITGFEKSDSLETLCFSWEAELKSSTSPQ